MKKKQFKIIANSIRDTSEVAKGDNIYYKCTKCKGIIPSAPKDNIGCKCGDIFIDVDCFILHVEDYSKIQVLEKLK